MAHRATLDQAPYPPAACHGPARGSAACRLAQYNLDEIITTYACTSKRASACRARTILLTQAVTGLPSNRSTGVGLGVLTHAISILQRAGGAARRAREGPRYETSPRRYATQESWAAARCAAEARQTRSGAAGPRTERDSSPARACPATAGRAGRGPPLRGRASGAGGCSAICSTACSARRAASR